MLALAQKAIDEIPAYAKFLKLHGLSLDEELSQDDFSKLPITDKNSYLKQYPLPELVWGGALDSPLVFCSTSGSTGAPFYFPRSEKLSWQYSWLIQDYLKQNANSAQPTLVITALGMGVWIGGVLTHRAFEIAIQRLNYPASLLSTGYNKVEIFKALKQLSPIYGTTIIMGYPPFVKQLIDEAPGEGIDLKKLRIRFMFAAESFTETFRDYICKQTGAQPLLDTLNIYGTADIGAMAYETPLSILIRRLATRNTLFFQDIFGQIQKTPTLAQYNPKFMHFEAINGQIVLTGDSALPLIRYAVGDHGGAWSYEQIKKIAQKNGIDLKSEIEKAKIGSLTKRHPFVYVYERTDFSVTLHGINIYPEFIKEGLLSPELLPYFTERFTMVTRFDVHHNQYLEVNLELRKDAVGSSKLKAQATKLIRLKLAEKSSEFAEVSKSRASKNLLKIILWPQEHPKYFAPGVKQKWVQS